jgi:hypothetical protein
MRGNYQFREPLLVDDSGLYITAAQMKFFLNRINGKEKFRSGDSEFINYYKNCCLYNLVYDMMEDNAACAKMYWDESTKSVALSFPIRGKVAQVLTEVAASFGGLDGEDPDEDEDPFSLFSQ